MIYRHYENLQKKGDQSANVSFQENIQRVQGQVQSLQSKIEQLEMTNNLNQKKLEIMINDKNLLKENQEIISNLSANDLRNKLTDLKKKNDGLEKEIKQIELDQNQAIYNIKFKFE